MVEDPKELVSKEPLMREVWRLHRRLFSYERPHFTRTIAKFGLSASDYRILMALKPQEPSSMGALAELWSCDASTVTWIVGGAERRHLVKRSPAPADRRVRVVSLTPLGLRTRTRLQKELDSPPDVLAAFSTGELSQLRSLLERLSLPAID
jgi:DNA-binding MarR family transcriptional regulator